MACVPHENASGLEACGLFMSARYLAPKRPVLGFQPALVRNPTEFRRLCLLRHLHSIADNFMLIHILCGIERRQILPRYSYFADSIAATMKAQKWGTVTLGRHGPEVPAQKGNTRRSALQNAPLYFSGLQG